MSLAAVAPEPVSYRARVLGPAERSTWERFYAAHPMARAIVPHWETLAGWRNVQLGLFAGSKLDAALILSVRRVPWLPLGISRVNALLLSGRRPEPSLHALLAALDRYALTHLLVETELRLRVAEGPAGDDAEHRLLARALPEHGYHALGKVETSYLVPIDRDDEALISAFDRSARNKIRKAQKAGAQVSTSRDPALMELFHEAYQDMGRRKHAQLAPGTLVGQGMLPLIQKGYAELYVESYAGVPSNLAVVDTLGTPAYVLGVRSPANVAGEVQGAAQMLHFEIMRRLRDRGKRRYDLGGCEGPVPIEGHPNYGVWRFKYGFGAPFVRFLPFYRKTRGPLSGPVLEAIHKHRGDYV